MVFHVLPDAVGNLFQFALDVGRIENGIYRAAEFNPPEIVVLGVVDAFVVELYAGDGGFGRGVIEVVVREMISPVGSGEGMVLVGLAQLQEDGVAHGAGVAAFMQIGLVELVRKLAAAAEFGAAQAQDAVARAVQEEFAAQAVVGVGIGVPGLDGGNAGPVHFHLVHGGVQQQGDVGLGNDGGINDIVPKRIALEGVVAEVPQLHFLQDAGFLILVFENAHNAHPAFAGGVSAQHGTVLHQDDGGAVTGRRDRCANAGQAAAAHHDIRVFFHVADHLGILFREHLGLNGKGKRHQDDSAERFENPVHRLILLRRF